MHYLSKNILNRNISHFLKHIFVDCLVVVIIVLTTRWFNPEASNYRKWIIIALKYFAVSLIGTVVINAAFYRKEIGESYKLIINKVKAR